MTGMLHFSTHWTFFFSFYNPQRLSLNTVFWESLSSLYGILMFISGWIILPACVSALLRKGLSPEVRPAINALQKTLNSALYSCGKTI